MVKRFTILGVALLISMLSVGCSKDDPGVGDMSAPPKGAGVVGAKTAGTAGGPQTVKPASQ